MRKLLVAVFALGLAGLWSATAQEKDSAKKAEKVPEQGKAAAARAAAPARSKSAAQPAPPKEPEKPKASPQDEAVRTAAEALIKAYDAHDAKAFAAAFTAEGEFVDEKGTVYHGRKAIEEEFTGFFKANPNTTIELALASARSIAAGIVATDGITRFTRAKGEPAVFGRCHLVCAREEGKSLIASLHEIEAADEQFSHHDHVQQLEWLVGDWIDEGSDSHVHFSCRWDEGGNYLVRDFAVHIAGQKTITGTQRIGYDPVSGHLKAWVFDSAGGYADGYFHREGDSWILHTSGVTADGKMASGTSIFTPIDKHRMSWEAVDRVIGGERVADIQKVTIVRKPPNPTAKAK